METARDLFIHELAGILDGERKLVITLGRMAGQSENKKLRRASSSAVNRPKNRRSASNRSSRNWERVRNQRSAKGSPA